MKDEMIQLLNLSEEEIISLTHNVMKLYGEYERISNELSVARVRLRKKEELRDCLEKNIKIEG